MTTNFVINSRIDPFSEPSKKFRAPARFIFFANFQYFYISKRILINTELPRERLIKKFKFSNYPETLIIQILVCHMARRWNSNLT